MFKKTPSVYRTILKRSWEITIKNKFLWFFGIFAAIAGNGGIYEIFAKGFNRVSERGEFVTPGESLWSYLDINKLETFYEKTPLFVTIFWFVFILAIIIIAVAICLSILSKGAIINSSKKLAGKKKVDFKDGWEAGTKYFWRLLGLNIFSKAVIFGLLVLLTIPVMLFISGGDGNFIWNLVLYILSFVFFTGLALLVSFITVFASCFIAAEDYSLVEAIRAGLRLFARNWLTAIEMALILFAISFVVGLALIIFTILYLIPVALLLLAFTYLELVLGFWLILFLSSLFWMAIVICLGGLLSTFQFSAWTLLFMDLNKGKIWSKLLRFVGIGA
ncbi:hypothetical protein A2316_04255 [Candidatus Falkowbacteria bacterium RIFOXYB2_FULL_38_15]|uniref:Glycerophosphoryl diester phosphodiesterase membrane domain-containing protein n=1 Tax=Candidatus Falkowbacteria bacterium RIFOXYA2_FULL_38_12 TaxID=1797993 RepID=A0A1F5S4G9_9BACT|nr:MAG: hypothetical protein A2257_01175 [Candidatus Falkowbacteria bacterium RIFOXYA2_FULL_38_12]OGF33706.1 MAG: hypothetical protein A2316_04255 [Candidatus Falkowbacteria bacterium RIFOXYB2_FULL_38_15]OGF42279.1 MAG: hypothetical protein A2555_04285 [Candidatus Falkowbacteria bacterium RIFOXYD2_FULL_39_16]